MPDANIPPCITHGAPPRALHEHNFAGIVQVITDIIDTVSGVGTTSFSRCPYGYPANFEGIVRVLEDLNTSISGIQGGGVGGGLDGITPGSGIYVQPVASGEVEIGINIIGEGGINVNYSGDFVIISGQSDSAISVISGLAAGPGIDVFASGAFTVVQTDLVGEGTVDFGYRNGTGVISGMGSDSVLTAGSGIIITDDVIMLDAEGVGGVDIYYDGNTAQVSGEMYTGGSGIFVTENNEIMLLASGTGSVDISYDGDLAVISGAQGTDIIVSSGGAGITVSGNPGTDIRNGSLWFDTNQGRLFVYASGEGIEYPDWYQTNAEAIALKGETAPSGTGTESPPRDGSIWWNSLMGGLFVYDAATSGWYESAPTRQTAFSPSAPTPKVPGETWYSSTDSQLKVWNGTAWVDANS